MKKVGSLIAIIIIVFVTGMLVNHYWFSRSQQYPSKTSSIVKKEPKILYWVAPMDPTYRRNKPGKSPMGMDMLAVYTDGPLTGKGIIKISPAIENNLGVKTAVVVRKDLPRVINSVGYVTVDENNIEHVNTYTEGWIKVLNVKTTGELVRKGQLLFELFSPTLVNAQEEYILALQHNNTALVHAGQKKLLTLGVLQSQINQLRRTQRVMRFVKIYATQSGIVSELNVREGKFVKPDTLIMSIEDLTTIWVIVDVFERQANWVKEGQPAIATLPYMPGKTWEGKVDYVYPHLDQKTHTLRVRLTFPNPDLTIKPKMYANVKILSSMIKNTLAVPRSSVIRTGEGDRVIIALGNGRYKAQMVKLGIESGDYYQILSGLKKGDKVVISAQFLIDSESNLKAAIGRLQNHQHSKRQQENENMPQQFVGMGKIKAINLNERTISLHHKPIPLLNMPAMTMKLAVVKALNLGNVKSGDEIHFVIVKQKNNTYIITKIHVIKSSKP